MIQVKKIIDLQKKIKHLKEQHYTIGFVPTMGALHLGHISLITKAKKECDFVVCSIFVNPTQFNNTKDFEKYPNTIEKDIELLVENNCDLLYLPIQNEIYPYGLTNLKKYELGFIETVYDGEFRPGHFQGVCNVVEKLFEIVQPTIAYFGLKDYQQCMVISKLIELNNWQQKLKIQLSETLREDDGLAMSSRNMRLNAEERNLAPIIYQTLQNLKSNLNNTNQTEILSSLKQNLIEKGFKIDYLDIADATSLMPVNNWDGKQKIVCLIAVFLNEIRLIDNLIIN